MQDAAHRYARVFASVDQLDWTPLRRLAVTPAYGTWTTIGATKRVTGTLRGGKVTLTVPKLAKGTWRAKVTYRPSTNFRAKTKTIKVKITR